MRVSVIIAAYGRLASLQRAVASALRQTWTSLEVLVVCDAADPDFIRSLHWDDPRVRILNLSERAGAQYGPNSIGMQHADGEVLAFLNHDDLWLDDHLDRSLEIMRQEGSNFHLSTAAFIQPEQPDGRRLRFDHTNGPFERWRTAHRIFNVFEPASAWLVDAAFARRVGPWIRPSPAQPVSVAEWVARATRLGARFSFDALPTVMKVNLHHGHKGLSYGPESPQHALLGRLLELPAAVVRSEILDDVGPQVPLSVRAHQRAVQLQQHTWSARRRYLLYRLTGDPRHLKPRRRLLPRLAWRLLQPRTAPPTERARTVSGRTGEPIRPFPPVDALSADEIQRT